MKLFIVKSNDITQSESFIHGHKTFFDDAILIHGKYPVEFGETVSSKKKLIYQAKCKFLKLRGKESSIVYRRYLSRLIKIHRPQAVLAEYGITAAKMHEICKKSRIPLIIHFHGYDAHVQSILERNRKEYRDMFKTSSATIAVSRSMRNILLELGSDPDTTFVNPCGVDTTLFKKRTAYDNYLLTVGRFVEKKAPYNTLLAFKKFQTYFPNFSLKMVGDGPLLNACRDIAESLGIRDKVEFLGAQPHQVVSDLMSRAFIFVQHSIVAVNGDSEGSPVAIAEAGASGVPVVSTYHAGIPDLVINNHTGYLVEEKDVNSMAKAMITLGENDELAREMGANAFEYINKNYSHKTLNKRLSEIVCWGAGLCNKKPDVMPQHILD